MVGNSSVCVDNNTGGFGLELLLASEADVPRSVSIKTSKISAAVLRMDPYNAFPNNGSAGPENVV